MQQKRSKYKNVILPPEIDGKIGYHPTCYSLYIAISSKQINSRHQGIFLIITFFYEFLQFSLPLFKEKQTPSCADVLNTHHTNHREEIQNLEKGIILCYV